MSQKSLIWWGTVIGGIIGGYIPSLWDANMFSVSSVIFTAIGGIVGIWIGYRLS